MRKIFCFIFIFFLSLIHSSVSESAAISKSDEVWDLLAANKSPNASIQKEANKKMRALLDTPVSLTGWVIPNEFNKGKLDSFFLTRFPAGCIHVPFPPSYYVVQVKMGKNAKNELHDLIATTEVVVEGHLSLDGGRVDADYSMEASSAILK